MARRVKNRKGTFTGRCARLARSLARPPSALRAWEKKGERGAGAFSLSALPLHLDFLMKQQVAREVKVRLELISDFLGVVVVEG